LNTVNLLNAETLNKFHLHQKLTNKIKNIEKIHSKPKIEIIDEEVKDQ
jgi:N-acetyl-beta-hexosaminidase